MKSSPLTHMTAATAMLFAGIGILVTAPALWDLIGLIPLFMAVRYTAVAGALLAVTQLGRSVENLQPARRRP